MDFGFFKNFPWFGFRSKFGLVEPVDAKKTSSLSTVVSEQPPPPSKHALKSIIVQLQGRWFPRPIIPWWVNNDTSNANDENQASPSPAKESKYNKFLQGRYVEPGCTLPLFRPYVARVPWHKGARAFLSQLFPRYGHYCGPNWSSGKDNGSLLWDRRPIDWLDFCCYCHDIGYDTHDQAKLLKADLAFLECLEKSWISTTVGDVHLAYLYRTMCITGLKNLLIPYRRQLVRMKHGQSTEAERVDGKLDMKSGRSHHT